MFTPDQISSTFAVLAMVDPNSVLGQLFKLVVELQVDPHDLMVEKQDFSDQIEKMLRKAIFADNVVSQAEQPVVDFLNDLRADPAKQASLDKDIMSLIHGVKE